MLKKINLLFIFLIITCILYAVNNNDYKTIFSVSIKVPGNKAIDYPLSLEKRGSSNSYIMKSESDIPLIITRDINSVNGKTKIRINIQAKEDVYFNYSEKALTGYSHNDCQFLMPGFWYRKNLLSPKQAPSFHTSDSWTVREDRLSTPLTGIFNEKNGEYITITRIDSFTDEALITHKEGEVIISGKTSIGFTGFENVDGQATVHFGYPYQETPKSYIRKLTLIPPIKSFQMLKEGESIQLEWELISSKAKDYSDFVKKVWEYSYDTYNPQPVTSKYTTEQIKATIVSYFKESFVNDKALKYMSGAHLRVNDCRTNGVAEVGFIGRVLLNAYNAYEYGFATAQNDLIENSRSVFNSYLQHGFTASGLLREYIDFNNGTETDIFSIRRQSEGIYAIFHYLQYEKNNGRRHPEWEARIKSLLDKFLSLQNKDGSFPRKFKDDMTIVDKSGGSTPSATLPLVMAYKYFKDEKYLVSAKRTAEYLETQLINKADYFSSTLDANCEDKEASLYASTAMYYLSLISKGKERTHYADLSRKAAYFTLSWYYTWDVPFARGQMLGDIGLKSRGWGNVSVENNHIDAFIFEFASVLDWLSLEYKEPRLSAFSEVIRSSMKQLLPVDGFLCGVAKKGYYPEVVQHTNWDYGKNGKGFYNDIFAPGWVVASLWELYTPDRAKHFLLN